MRRRDFITLFGAATVAWPLTVRAQQPQQMRRIGVLMVNHESDPIRQTNIASFRQGLQELGWTEGRNVRIDYRWGGGDPERMRRYAAELVALAPDILVGSGASVRPLQQATRTVPIVFQTINDPVGGGYVASLARPGGNTTGFGGLEYGASGKWLELLKQIAPRVTRVAVPRDPNTPGGFGQFGALQGAAPSFGLELSPVDARDPGEIERALAAFARGPNGGMIVTLGNAGLHRELIISLAARHRLPAVYPNRLYVTTGGLISYGVVGDNYRRAAGYVDRILKGEKPADLPVQMPTRYETVLNMKTAKALGLTVPDLLLVRADEVIE